MISKRQYLYHSALNALVLALILGLVLVLAISQLVRPGVSASAKPVTLFQDVGGDYGEIIRITFPEDAS